MNEPSSYGCIRIKGGKYSGWTIDEVATKYPDYVEYCRHHCLRKTLLQLISYYDWLNSNP